jgi:hypothetical protein
VNSRTWPSYPASPAEPGSSAARQHRTIHSLIQPDNSHATDAREPLSAGLPSKKILELLHTDASVPSPSGASPAPRLPLVAEPVVFHSATPSFGLLARQKLAALATLGALHVAALPSGASPAR